MVAHADDGDGHDHEQAAKPQRSREKAGLAPVELPAEEALDEEGQKEGCSAYDADFGGPYFQYDRSPISREGKAYSTDVWEFPAGAILSMMARESISDPYYTTYLEAEKRYRRFVYAHYLTIPEETRDAIASVSYTHLTLPTT